MATEIRLNRVDSSHSLIFRTADDDNTYYVSASGIVRPKLRSIRENYNGENWTYGNLIFDVRLPTASIPRPHARAVLKARHYTVYAGLNNIFDDANGIGEVGSNSGHALDEFRMTNAQNLSGHVAKVQCKLAVKSVGVRISNFSNYYVSSGVELNAIAFKINLLVSYF